MPHHLDASNATRRTIVVGISALVLAPWTMLQAHADGDEARRNFEFVACVASGQLGLNRSLVASAREAMKARDETIEARVDRLAKKLQAAHVRPGADLTFSKDLLSGDEHGTLSSVARALYLGRIGDDEKDGIVFAYATALMFATLADRVVIPSMACYQTSSWAAPQ